MSKKENKSKQGSKKQQAKSSGILSKQSEQEKAMREKELLQRMKEENMIKYYQSINNSEISKNKVEIASNSVISGISQKLTNGQILLAEKATNMSLLLDNTSKIPKEKRQQIQLKAKRQKIQKKIDYLVQQIKGNVEGKSQQFVLIEGKEILSKEEHERIVKERHQQRLQKKRRLEEQLQEIKSKEKEEEEKREQARCEQQKQREIKRVTLQQKIKKRQQEHQRLMEFYAKSKEEQHQLAKQETLFHIMESRYQTEQLNPLLEQKKLKLKELRNFNKQYDIEAIKQHEKNYIQKKKSLSTSKLEVKKWQYIPPPKTQKLTQLLEEQILAGKQKLEEKKKRIQQKIKKEEQFAQLLKAKFRPKIDEIKRKQMQDRFLAQMKKYERIVKDGRRIGLQNLSVAKSLKRSNSVRLDLNEKESFQKTQKKQSLSILKHHQQEFYENLRRKKMQKIANSQDSVVEKYSKLRVQSEKLNEKIKQKAQLLRYSKDGKQQQQAADLLVSSIKAKMSMINLYKQN